MWVGKTARLYGTHKETYRDRYRQSKTERIRKRPRQKRKKGLTHGQTKSETSGKRVKPCKLPRSTFVGGANFRSAPDGSYEGSPNDIFNTPLWFRIAMNRDASTGPLARTFACLLAPLTHSLAPHCLLRTACFALLDLHCLLRTACFTRAL